LRTQLKITIRKKFMVHLPLPEPWTLETLSEYIEELVKFVTEYGDIARFNTRDVFVHGLPVDWVPEHDLETWVAIVSGKHTENWSKSFSRFVHLSKTLPLHDHAYSPSKISTRKRQGFSPKKEHEVDAMLDFVAKTTCAQNLCVKNVVDVGSGLGYLSAELATVGYRVVAVDGDPDRPVKAIQHAQVEHVCKTITNHTDLDIVEGDCISLSLRMLYA
jgi:Methyltransferase domain